MQIHDLEQGSDEWHQIRNGLITASEVKLLVTPAKLTPANNDKSRAHLYELLAQRISGYTEPTYLSDDMLRGQEDEPEARELYSFEYDDVTEAGFITEDKWGFAIGYSPDGLIGNDGLIEIKSRRQKYQIETILNSTVPTEYMLQIQTGLLVTGRKWCDFISYCGGLPMVTIRVEPDPAMHDAILAALTEFERQLGEMEKDYRAKLADKTMRLINTERKERGEII